MSIAIYYYYLWKWSYAISIITLYMINSIALYIMCHAVHILHSLVGS